VPGAWDAFGQMGRGNIADSLTEGRHALLFAKLLWSSRSSLSVESFHLQRSTTTIEAACLDKCRNALHVYPPQPVPWRPCCKLGHHKIDMASLIQMPEELFLSEEEVGWEGLFGRREDCIAQNQGPLQPKLRNSRSRTGEDCGWSLTRA